MNSKLGSNYGSPTAANLNPGNCFGNNSREHFVPKAAEDWNERGMILLEALHKGALHSGWQILVLPPPRGGESAGKDVGRSGFPAPPKRGR